jgi:signal peptidase II
MKSLALGVVAAVLVVGLDLLSKVLAERVLDVYQPVPIVGQFLRLTLGYNTGVAFGLFANGGSWPVILTGAIIFGMVVWLLQLLRSREFPSQVTIWPIGLFFGGAIANFVDRLPDGRVTDWLDVGIGASRWPTFNLADSFIVLGVAILMQLALFEQRQREREA